MNATNQQGRAGAQSPAGFADRNDTIKERYRHGGETLKSLSVAYGITPERVRQIITRKPKPPRAVFEPGGLSARAANCIQNVIGKAPLALPADAIAFVESGLIDGPVPNLGKIARAEVLAYVEHHRGVSAF